MLRSDSSTPNFSLGLWLWLWLCGVGMEQAFSFHRPVALHPTSGEMAMGNGCKTSSTQ